MATRFISNELDLNLPALTTALLVVVVVAPGSLTLAFDAAGDVARRAISGMIVELSR